MNGIFSRSKVSQSAGTLQPPVDTALLHKMLANRLREQDVGAFVRSSPESPELVVFTLLALQNRRHGSDVDNIRRFDKCLN